MSNNSTNKKLRTKELINMHGPSGKLVMSLRRYALLGWILAAILFVLLVLTLFIDSLRDVPVLAVDETGRVLGTFEYLDNNARTNEEITLTLKRWVDAKTSSNSSTIYEDHFFYQSLCSDELYLKEINIMQANLAPKKIKDAKLSSYVEWDDNQTKILKKEGKNITFNAVGKVVIRESNTKLKFNYTISAKIVPRTPKNTSGLIVTDYKLR